MANIRASLAEFDTILKVHPHHTSSHWNRGLAYADLCTLMRRTAEWSRAVEACDHAIADFREALLPGVTYDNLPTSRPDEADVLFNRGLAHQQKADLRALTPAAKLVELSRAIQDYDEILMGQDRYQLFLQKRRSEVVKAKQIAAEMRVGLAKQPSSR